MTIEDGVLRGKNSIPAIDALREQGYMNSADMLACFGRTIGMSDNKLLKSLIETLNPVADIDFLEAKFGSRTTRMYTRAFQIRIVESLKARPKYAARTASINKLVEELRARGGA